jgi:hypothetical protein
MVRTIWRERLEMKFKQKMMNLKRKRRSFLRDLTE